MGLRTVRAAMLSLSSWILRQGRFHRCGSAHDISYVYAVGWQGSLVEPISTAVGATKNVFT